MTWLISNPFHENIPRHLPRLLPLFEPLLGGAALVVEVDDLPVRELCVGHDEAQPREQLPGMMLNFCHYPPCHRPTGRPIEKTLVPHNGLMSRTAHRPREQLCNVPQQEIG